MKITRGIQPKPLKVVVYGPEGIGKSTFASMFPDPLFIDTEGSTARMDVARTETPTSLAMLMQFLTEIRDNRSEEHTSELQSRGHLVCRLLLEKKKKKK